MPQLKTTVKKVRDALCEHGLLVWFRVKNNKLDYSIMNRPEPELSGVTDHSLATAIVGAVEKFSFARAKRMATVSREAVARDDGRQVKYKDSIDINWENGTIETTANHSLTRLVLAAIVENLMVDSLKTQAAKAGLN